MNENPDFYKVFHAVLNTIRYRNSLLYIKSDGTSGTFEWKGNITDVVKNIHAELFQYQQCDLVRSSHDGWEDVWELWSSIDGLVSYIQLSIDRSYYISNSYELRDMMACLYDLQEGEITTGINGYPSNLRGCLLFGSIAMSFKQMQELAELVGVRIVQLRRKYGWRLWEERGDAFGLFNYQEFLTSHNDNILDYPDFKTYARDLRERAGEIREYEEDDKLADKFEAHANDVENKEMAEDSFIWVRCDEMLSYEEEKIHVDGFWYDTWSYVLALDCRIDY